MTARNDDAIDTLLERIDNKHRINSTQGHNPNDSHSGGILKPICPGKTRSCIGTPVAEKCKEEMLKSFFHQYPLISEEYKALTQGEADGGKPFFFLCHRCIQH